MCAGACGLKPAGERCGSCSSNYRNTAARIPPAPTNWFGAWMPSTRGRPTGLEDTGQYAGGWFGAAASAANAAQGSDFQSTSGKSTSGGGSTAGGLSQSDASVITGGIDALAGLIRNQQQADLERDRLAAQAAARRDAINAGYGIDGTMPNRADTSSTPNASGDSGVPALQRGPTPTTFPWTPVLIGGGLLAFTKPGQKFVKGFFK